MEKTQTTDESVEKLWRVYSKNRDAAIKDKLILHYVYLVKFVAGRLRIHLGTHAEYEDMVSYGIFGLIDAVEKFDYVKGVKFETYATVRIRGSIIDSLRKMDWAPRNLRQRSKEVGRIYTELETELGREPTDEELAAKLDCSADKVADVMRKSSVAALISLDDYLSKNYETSFSEIEKTAADDPEEIFTQKENARILAETINRLNDKEKKIISLYYFEEMTLREISLIMDVSESRVSQLHTKAILKLKNKLGKHLDAFLR